MLPACKLIVLYDGTCGLCNRLNIFVLRRDRRDRFRFVAQQDALGREILTGFDDIDPKELSTLYVVEGCGTQSPRLYRKAEAVLVVLSELGSLWPVIRIAKILPRFLLDALYDLVARHRYRFFGRSGTCALPAPGWADKFL